MTILKQALLCSLRIVVLGALKLSLFAYTLFLSGAAFAGAVPESKGYVGEHASYAPENNSDASIGKVKSTVSGRPASGR
jgi:hypothetical protein